VPPLRGGVHDVTRQNRAAALLSEAHAADGRGKSTTPAPLRLSASHWSEAAPRWNPRLLELVARRSSLELAFLTKWFVDKRTSQGFSTTASRWFLYHRFDLALDLGLARARNRAASPHRPSKS
jgi:hypothetical protein